MVLCHIHGSSTDTPLIPVNVHENTTKCTFKECHRVSTAGSHQCQSPREGPMLTPLKGIMPMWCLCMKGVLLAHKRTFSLPSYNIAGRTTCNTALHTTVRLPTQPTSMCLTLQLYIVKLHEDEMDSREWIPDDMSLY